MISIFLTMAVIFISCYSAEHLHESGTYTIRERNGDETEFYEVRGKYKITSDTLKKNDKIVINVIKASSNKKSRKI